MAKKVITKKARVSVVKKRWYALQAPQVFNNVIFGETPAAEIESLVGRGIRTNLGTVIRTAKKTSLEARFKITEVKGNTCMTELVSLEILPPHVKRLVKRAKKRVDDSFVVETKDGIKVRVKPVLLVKDNVQHGILTALRQRGQEFFAAQAKELTFNEFINKILAGDIFRDLRADLKKIYPLAGVELRALVRL